jgi:hypothetical protein
VEQKSIDKLSIKFKLESFGKPHSLTEWAFPWFQNSVADLIRDSATDWRSRSWFHSVWETNFSSWLRLGNKSRFTLKTTLFQPSIQSNSSKCITLSQQECRYFHFPLSPLLPCPVFLREHSLYHESLYAVHSTSQATSRSGKILLVLHDKNVMCRLFILYF